MTIETLNTITEVRKALNRADDALSALYDELDGRIDTRGRAAFGQVEKLARTIEDALKQLEQIEEVL